MLVHFLPLSVIFRADYAILRTNLWRTFNDNLQLVNNLHGESGFVINVTNLTVQF
jgi:hypothetical protein